VLSLFTQYDSAMQPPSTAWSPLAAGRQKAAYIQVAAFNVTVVWPTQYVKTDMSVTHSICKCRVIAGVPALLKFEIVLKFYSFGKNVLKMAFDVQ